MSDLKSTKAWHIENLIEVEPDCQVVLLADALELESKLRARIKELEQNSRHAFDALDSFLTEHESKEVRVNDLNGFGYIDVRLDPHIDWSELTFAMDLIAPQPKGE